MRQLINVGALIGLAACTAPSVIAAVPADPAPQGVTSLPRCTQAVLGRYIGMPRSNAVARRMKHATGAKTVRWVPVGMMVNMIYQYDRLTVRLDGHRHIAQVSCN